MRDIGRHRLDRQIADLTQIHGGIAVKAAVFGGHLAGAVLKLPGRIGKNRAEFRSPGAGEQIVGGVGHCVSSRNRRSVMPKARIGQPPPPPPSIRGRSFDMWVVDAP